MKNVQGASDSGDDRFGVAIREGNGPPRRRTFRLTEIIPRIQQRFDGATEWGAHRRGQLARYWRSAISDGEEARNHAENDQQVQENAGEEVEASYTYYGRVFDDSKGGSGDNHVRVPVPYPRGGFVHVCCMLGRAEHLVRGHVDARSCVACHSEWAGRNRPSYTPEPARGLTMTEPRGR